MRTRLAAPLLSLALAGALGLTGCGDDQDALADRPAPSAEEPGFNPCTALDVAEVSGLLDADLRKDAGSPAAPRCSFTPTAEGGPVLDANYLLFPEGLQAVFDSMGELDPDDVSTIEVRGADDARLVVDFDDRQLFVTGFVQDGDLIQTVDVVDPLPYDRERVVRAVRRVLAVLSQSAPADTGSLG